MMPTLAPPTTLTAPNPIPDEYKVILGPGPDAYKVIGAGNAIIKTPGVIDCAVVLAWCPGTEIRGLAHYNNFSGPTAEGFADFFKRLKTLAGLHRPLTVAVVLNGDLRLKYNRDGVLRLLAPHVGNDAVLPSYELDDVAKGEMNRKGITVYFGKNGDVTATSP
jgi:hypothetical protein